MVVFTRSSRRTGAPYHMWYIVKQQLYHGIIIYLCRGGVVVVIVTRHRRHTPVGSPRDILSVRECRPTLRPTFPPPPHCRRIDRRCPTGVESPARSDAVAVLRPPRRGWGVAGTLLHGQPTVPPPIVGCWRRWAFSYLRVRSGHPTPFGTLTRPTHIRGQASRLRSRRSRRAWRSVHKCCRTSGGGVVMHTRKRHALTTAVVVAGKGSLPPARRLATAGAVAVARGRATAVAFSGP